MHPDGEPTWPRVLWVVRHGESAGNLARTRAEARGEEQVGLPTREMDVPLSERGERQAAALGGWFASLPPHERPTSILSSPHLRARATAERIVDEGLGRAAAEIVLDERLREREFGVLDDLTKKGIQKHLPGEAARRRRLGKFLYRPPGGESWCDVILRLRSVLGTLSRAHGGERVVLVAHSVVVLCVRYVLEHLTEAELLELDRSCEIANCSVTVYEHDPAIGRWGGLALRAFNWVGPLESLGAEPTGAPDVPVEDR